MSLLLANGHPEARRYPIGKVWDEAHLVVERLNTQAATQALLTQMAVSALLTKEGEKTFNEMLERLTDG